MWQNTRKFTNKSKFFTFSDILPWSTKWQIWNHGSKFAIPIIVFAETVQTRLSTSCESYNSCQSTNFQVFNCKKNTRLKNYWRWDWKENGFWLFWFASTDPAMIFQSCRNTKMLFGKKCGFQSSWKVKNRDECDVIQGNGTISRRNVFEISSRIEDIFFSFFALYLR